MDQVRVVKVMDNLSLGWIGWSFFQSTLALLEQMVTEGIKTDAKTFCSGNRKCSGCSGNRIACSGSGGVASN